MGEEHTPGHSRPSLADLSGDSGWVTTDVAAKAVRVSPRTIRRYIDQGKLEAKLQGEGVRREWLVSVDSLHALRASRTTEGDVPDVSPGVEPVDSIADVVREMAARLESRAEEAAQLRVRLELTERAQSTLEDERRQAIQELEQERRRREEAEREREDLRQQLKALTDERESPQTVEEEPQSAQEEEPHPAQGGEEEAQEEGVQKPQEKRSWWRRLLGGG